MTEESGIKSSSGLIAGSISVGFLLLLISEFFLHNTPFYPSITFAGIGCAGIGILSWIFTGKMD